MFSNLTTPSEQQELNLARRLEGSQSHRQIQSSLASTLRESSESFTVVRHFLLSVTFCIRDRRDRRLPRRSTHACAGNRFDEYSRGALAYTRPLSLKKGPSGPNLGSFLSKTSFSRNRGVSFNSAFLIVAPTPRTRNCCRPIV